MDLSNRTCRTDGVRGRGDGGSIPVEGMVGAKAWKGAGCQSRDCICVKDMFVLGFPGERGP